VDAGTHEELMTISATYLNLVRKQLQWGDGSNATSVRAATTSDPE
jgi:hypothetical protein